MKANTYIGINVLSFTFKCKASRYKGVFTVDHLT